MEDDARRSKDQAKSQLAMISHLHGGAPLRRQAARECEPQALALIMTSVVCRRNMPSDWGRQQQHARVAAALAACLIEAQKWCVMECFLARPHPAMRPLESWASPADSQVHAPQGRRVHVFCLQLDETQQRLHPALRPGHKLARKPMGQTAVQVMVRHGQLHFGLGSGSRWHHMQQPHISSGHNLGGDERVS